MDRGSLLARFQHTEISLGDIGTKFNSAVLPVLLYYLQNGVIEIKSVAKPAKKTAAVADRDVNNAENNYYIESANSNANDKPQLMLADSTVVYTTGGKKESFYAAQQYDMLHCQTFDEHMAYLCDLDAELEEFEELLDAPIADDHVDDAYFMGS